MKEMIENVGEIITGDYDPAEGGSLLLQTKKRFYLVTTKPSYIVGTGTCDMGVYKKWKPKRQYEKEVDCNDPRVIFMYLYPYWRVQHGKSIKNPVPTMKEAIEWLKSADVPIRWDLKKGYRNGGNPTEKQRKFFNL